jgi:hypothetical protein
LRDLSASSTEQNVKKNNPLENRREILSARKRVLLFSEMTLRLAHAQQAELFCKKQLNDNNNNNDNDDDDNDDIYNDNDYPLLSTLSFASSTPKTSSVGTCLRLSAEMALQSKGALPEFALKFIAANTTLKDRNNVSQVCCWCRCF